MYISEVKTAIYVGKCKMVNNNPKKKWEIIWSEEVPDEIFKNSDGRVYLFTVNGIIFKIGGSKDKGGIKGTMKWYENSAFSGNPSVRTHGIHMLVSESLENGNDVHIYLIPSEKVMAKVNGLFETVTKKCSIDFKEVEKQCKDDYYSIHKCYPEWNFQENNKKWSIEVSEGCNQINNTSTNKRKNKIQ